jgi:tRNA U34 2-thiouridine synthase MnmA/TrmU
MNFLKVSFQDSNHLGQTTNNVAINLVGEIKFLDPEKEFKEVLEHLPQSKNKNGTITYQCPYCNGFYTFKGIYEHIDAKNEWKRKCTVPKRKLKK